ncbi:MAG: dienelactone hydrolase family protein [Pseudobdellovibrio sp.]
MKIFIMATAIVLLALSGQAKVKIETVNYKEGQTALEGFIVYDEAKLKNKTGPGIVVVHDWMGVSDYVKMRAEQLAEMGYVAFVADIYGKGTRPKDSKEAAEYAGKYRGGDRKLLRARAKAAFEELKKSKYVDANKISATGYCFGGTTVLEMARAGLPLKGVVSFHGGLSSVNPDDAKNIKAKILALHGAIDPYVSAAEVAQFQKELNEAKVDYQFVAYSGAVHAFSQKGAGNDPAQGAAYNEAADKRSFVAAKNFLEEVNK